MGRLLWFFAVLWLCGCASQIRSDKVFANTQLLYQGKDTNNNSKRSAAEMASYFLEMEYNPEQVTLSKVQKKKMASVFKKLVYPEEYTLYVSFGSGNTGNRLANLKTVFARAKDIKRKYGAKVKDIQIAYLKNQKANFAFLRLIA